MTGRTIELPERWELSVDHSSLVRLSKGGTILAVVMEREGYGFDAVYIDRRTNERSTLVAGVLMRDAIETVEEHLRAIAEGRA